MAGGAVDRPPDRRLARLRRRVRQRLMWHTGRAADRARHAARRGRPADRARRRCVPGVVPARLPQRALALHVQLRRRRGRRAAGQGRRPQRAARLPRDHGRVVLAPGEGARGRERLAERRLPLPRRRGSRRDEGGPRPGQPRELRRGGPGSARAERRHARRRRLPVRDPHEAVDARRARRRAGSRPRARRVPRRHRPHERRRPAARARPRRARRRAPRRRARATARGRHRLHVGGERRPLGGELGAL